MKEKESLFFKIYYFLAIINAIIGLADAFTLMTTKKTLNDLSLLYIFVTGTLGTALLIMSVIALIMVFRYKFSKITLVLPIYYLVIYFGVFLYGFLWGAISSLQGISAAEQLIPPGLIAVQIISSVFELVFCIYLLYKYR
ncbi:hypothetical protein HYW21_05905 [Candidatus Woesearchaeota archaeon]|nr:hypothetical protein [Candidatus Woesearchaeota archaeon]